MCPFTLWYDDSVNALAIEVEVARDGIKLTINIILETYALELVNLWKETGIERSSISSICQERLRF
jgi:hypothetical protein